MQIMDSLAVRATACGGLAKPQHRRQSVDRADPVRRFHRPIPRPAYAAGVVNRLGGALIPFAALRMYGRVRRRRCISAGKHARRALSALGYDPKKLPNRRRNASPPPHIGKKLATLHQFGDREELRSLRL